MWAWVCLFVKVIISFDLMLRNRFIAGGVVIALALLLWIGHECWWATPKAGEPITVPIATLEAKNMARLLDDVGIID